MPRLADPIGITTPVVTPAMLDVITFVLGKATTICVGVPTDNVMDCPLTDTFALARVVAPATVDVITCVPAVIVAFDTPCAEKGASEKAAKLTL